MFDSVEIIYEDNFFSRDRDCLIKDLPIDNRVFVFDDYLPRTLHHWVDSYIKTQNFWSKTNEVRGDSPTGLPHHSLWGATFFRKDYELDTDVSPRQTYMAKWLDRKIQTDFGFKWVRLQYMGLNSQTMGQDGTCHMDADRDDAYSLSFLYYTNTFWNPNWGGALRLYSEQFYSGIKEDMDEFEIGRVDFKPNRLLIFDGRIPHGAEAPHPKARYIDRRSIVLRGDEVRLVDTEEFYNANDRIYNIQ